MKILITGSNGFIGRLLSAQLIAEGHSAISFDVADGDISQSSSLDKLKDSGISHVFHLAARSFVPESWQDPFSFYQTNVMGTVSMLEFCRKTGASMTYISSYVYGNPEYLPVDEKHPLKPFNPYSHTKIISEETCRYYNKQFNVPLTIIRPFNIYGPGQDEKFLIPKICKQLLDPDKKEIEVIDLRPKRDYLFVDDLINLLVLTLNNPKGEAYNAGSGISAGVSDIVNALEEITGIKKPVVTSGENRPADIMDLYAGISKAENDLGWKPAYVLKEGLRKMISL